MSRAVRFPSPPVGSHLRDGGVEVFELSRPYRGPDGVTVPARWRSDGASVPRFLWRAVGHPFDSRWLAAALLHDWRYSRGIYPREECDRMLREEMELLGSGFFRRWAFWTAVRVCGGRHYGGREKRKARK